jgi:aryl-alcohol dehydrogenase-like predicted oxidoreductase
MKTVELGGQGLRVSVEGFGAMGMSAFYGARDETESIATLNRAVDLGMTLIDTAEAYGPFKNEKLISRALGPRRNEVILATKWGTDFTDDGHTKKWYADLQDLALIYVLCGQPFDEET